MKLRYTCSKSLFDVWKYFSVTCTDRMCVFNQSEQIHGPRGPQASYPRCQDGSGWSRQRSQSHRYRIRRHRLWRWHRSPLPGRTEQHPEHSRCIPCPWNVCSAPGCALSTLFAHRPRGRWRSRRWMQMCTVSGWARSPRGTKRWCLNSSRSSMLWAGPTSWSCVEESFPLRYEQHHFCQAVRLISLSELFELFPLFCNTRALKAPLYSHHGQHRSVRWDSPWSDFLYTMLWFNLEYLWDGYAAVLWKDELQGDV